MKTRISLIILLSAAAAVVNWVVTPRMSGRFYAGEHTVISVCYYDFDRNGGDEIFVLTAAKTQEGFIDGELYADKLYVLNNDPFFNSYSIIRSFDIEYMKASKVMAGDVNGDSVTDISLAVYKTAILHGIPAKRPHFYNMGDGGLNPLWMGSRMSRPFADYILTDFNGDGVDEVVSAEYDRTGKMLYAVYKWQGFGFILIAESGLYDRLDSFDGLNDIIWRDMDV